MTARVAVPLADISGQVRTPAHDDVALPALPHTHVVEYRDATGRLHDTSEAPAECALRQPKFGQAAGQAAVLQHAILRTVVAIDARPKLSRDVARRRLRASKRGDRIVCPTTALHRLGLARFRRLQQGQTKF